MHNYQKCGALSYAGRRDCINARSFSLHYLRVLALCDCGSECKMLSFVSHLEHESTQIDQHEHCPSPHWPKECCWFVTVQMCRQPRKACCPQCTLYLNTQLIMVYFHQFTTNQIAISFWKLNLVIKCCKHVYLFAGIGKCVFY